MLQGVPDTGDRHGAGHRHVLPLPADQKHEEPAEYAREVSHANVVLPPVLVWARPPEVHEFLLPVGFTRVSNCSDIV